MKTLVYYHDKNPKIVYEADRLNQNIRHALELNDIETTTLPYAENYEIVHLISPGDEGLFLEYRERKKVPIIYSALMCENDPDAMMLDGRQESSKLLPIALKSLSNADAIIVSNMAAKKFLNSNALITAPIYIVSPGVNLSRFEYVNKIDYEIFTHYFQINKPAKLVVSLGEYDSIDGLETLLDVAKGLPDIEFYFFGKARKSRLIPKKIRQFFRISPKNLHFNKLVPEDVYRSVMLNADVFFIPNYHTVGEMSILDAMAAKCQIIARSSAIINKDLVNESTAILCDNSVDLSAQISAYCEGKNSSTTSAAYEVAKENSLVNTGRVLKGIYLDIIERRKTK